MGFSGRVCTGTFSVAKSLKQMSCAANIQEFKKKEKKREEDRTTRTSLKWTLFRQDLLTHPRSGELRMQKLKSHLVRTHSLNVLPLKPGVGQYIAIHATLTARDFFLAYFYPSGSFTCIFSKTSPDFSLCWLWLTHGSCVGPQNKIGHPAGCRFPCRVPAECE